MSEEGIGRASGAEEWGEEREDVVGDPDDGDVLGPPNGEVGDSRVGECISSPGLPGDIMDDDAMVDVMGNMPRWATRREVKRQRKEGARV